MHNQENVALCGIPVSSVNVFLQLLSLEPKSESDLIDSNGKNCNNFHNSSNSENYDYYNSYSNDENCIYIESFIRDSLSLLKSKESILQQNNTNAPTRRYTFEDMIKVQDSLCVLNLLETVKYMDNCVNARALLHRFLYSNYDLKQCSIIDADIKKYKGRTTSERDLISINIPIKYGDILLAFHDEINQVSPSKSIRNQLQNYLLSNRNLLVPSATSRNLIDSPLKQDNQDVSTTFNSKVRFFLPIQQIFEFLLFFTYYDGRDFSSIHLQKNRNRLPKAKPRNTNSEFSYHIVLELMDTLYNPQSLCNPFTLNQQYRCDQVFLSRKLNVLYYYYELYTSDLVLDEIIRNYNLTYRQVGELKKIIFENIFCDSRFIVSGLTSSFLDFMLPFDINFQFSVFTPFTYEMEYDNFPLVDISEITLNKNLLQKELEKMKYHKSLHIEDLLEMKNRSIYLRKELLKIQDLESQLKNDPSKAEDRKFPLKKRTLETFVENIASHKITAILLFDSYVHKKDNMNNSIITYNDRLHLSISYNEKKIVNEINTNKFYEKYYLSENKFAKYFMKKDLAQENIFPIDFEIIKKALEITTP